MLKAPFPYFGGKTAIADIVWQALGDVTNFVDPFCGSNAVLLVRPGWHPGVQWLETVNDVYGFIPNFWRAVHADPDAVAHHADWPASECDLHARHAWLVGQKASMQAQLEGDPEWYDAKIAGYWVWGMAVWIGSGFCSGAGPWQVVDGQLVHLGNAGQGVHRKRVHLGDAGQGVQRQRVHLGNTGQGVHRKRVHLGDAGLGVHRKRVHLGNTGQGVHRQLVHLGDAGQGVQRQRVHLGNTGQGCAGCGEQGLRAWMHALSDRLERVRVCCGDWTRVCGPTPTIKQGLTGVLLDPPYSHAQGRDKKLYAEDHDVTADVLAWCQEWGTHPLMRIVLCGYQEYEVLDEQGWTRHQWSAHGGYGMQGIGTGRSNRERETLWLSPRCLPLDGAAQLKLFG